MLSQFALQRASDIGNQDPNANCMDLENYFYRLYSPEYIFTPTEKSSSLCVTMSRGGFVVSGEDITISDSHGNTEKGAFGAGDGRYNISTTNLAQKIYIYYIDSEVESELILITKTNWEGSITLQVEKKDNRTVTYNNQYIAFFNPNKLKASAKPLKDSLVYNNKETRDVYEIEFGSRRFLQIGIKSSVNADDIYKKANAAVVGKINVNVEGNKHSLPEKIMKVESGKFLSSNSPEFEVKDYAGYVPMRTGDAVTIAILVIICAAIVAAIVFNVVYFVILKKPCCACCSCCTCCPGNKESNQSEVATVLI